MLAQYIVNGILMGGLYACLAVGFSLIWGVLNIVNMLHGSAVVLGAYFCIFGVQKFGLPLYVVAPIACVSLYAAGYALQPSVDRVWYLIAIEYCAATGLTAVRQVAAIRALAKDRAVVIGLGLSNVTKCC